jgi:hypothetical protein
MYLLAQTFQNFSTMGNNYQFFSKKYVKKSVISLQFQPKESQPA